MTEAVPPVDPDPRLVRRFLRLAAGFWSGATRATATLMAAGLFACILLNLGAAIAVNRWNKLFFDALQNKDLQWIWTAVGLIIGLAILSAMTSVLQLQVRMRFQVRWRQWLTRALIERWMARRRFYQLSILDVIDNPEARIAEDGRLAVELLVDFAAGILNALLAAVSFVGVLWFIGGAITFAGVTIPGYLVWAVIIYSALTSLGMYILGRPLVARVEEKASAEADFRYLLTRTRENAETIALIGGDDDERGKLDERFSDVVKRWVDVIGRQARMLFLSSGNNVLAPVIPLLLGAPKYLAGEMTLGDLMQAAAAFAQVQVALNWLADNSLRLADWFAAARRVAALDLAFAKVDKLADGCGGRSIDLAESEDEGLRIRGLTIKQHNGAVMLADADVHIAPGEKVLVKGESGTGKSTLIRAMAGLWPWGEGTVLRPKGARLAFLPQRPYIPVGTLMDALDYPTEDRPLDRVRAADMLSRCGLEHLVSRLDEADNWSNTLSGGEQQRIGFARVLLKKPDLIIMDEATSALDEASQTRMMQLLREEAPNSIVLHVAHRPGLEAWHDREIVLTRVGSGPATVETPEPGVLDAGKRWLRKWSWRKTDVG